MTALSAMQALWGHRCGQPAVTPCPSLQMILNYVAQTGGHVYVLNVWRVAREGEVRRKSLRSPQLCPQDWALPAGPGALTSSKAGFPGWLGRGAGPTPCAPPWPSLGSVSLQDKLFQAHDHLEHRRLLWHGTNVAVVAAILKNGLRIMPHSGGRVGKGIYFASENSKSACYGEQWAVWGACGVSASPAPCGTSAKPLPCWGLRH